MINDFGVAGFQVSVNIVQFIRIFKVNPFSLTS